MAQCKCRYVGRIALEGFDSAAEDTEEQGAHIAADVLLVVSLFKGLQAVSLEDDAGTVLFACAIKEITECNVPTSSNHICCFVQCDEKKREIMHAFQFDSPEKAFEVQQIASAAMAAATSRESFSAVMSQTKAKHKATPKAGTSGTKTPKRTDRKKPPPRTPGVDIRKRRAGSGSSPKTTSTRTPISKSVQKSPAKSQSPGKNGMPKPSPARNGSRVKSSLSRTHSSSGSESKGKSQRRNSDADEQQIIRDTSEAGPAVLCVACVDASTMTDPMESQDPNEQIAQPVATAAAPDAAGELKTAETMQLILAILQPDPTNAIALVDGCISELEPFVLDPEDSPLEGLRDAVKDVVASKDKARMRVVKQANLANIISGAITEAQEVYQSRTIIEMEEVVDKGVKPTSVGVKPTSVDVIHMGCQTESIQTLDQESSTDPEPSQISDQRTQALTHSPVHVPLPAPAITLSSPDIRIELTYDDDDDKSDHEDLPTLTSPGSPIIVEQAAAEAIQNDEDVAALAAAESAAIEAAISKARADAAEDIEDELHDQENHIDEVSAEELAREPISQSSSHESSEVSNEPKPGSEEAVAAAAKALADLISNAASATGSEAEGTEKESDAEDHVSQPLTMADVDGTETVASGGATELARYAIELFSEAGESADITGGSSYLEKAQQIESRVKAAPYEVLHHLKSRTNSEDAKIQFIDSFFLMYRVFMDSKLLMTEITNAVECEGTRSGGARAAIFWATYYWVDFKNSDSLRRSLLKLVQRTQVAAMRMENDDHEKQRLHSLCVELDHTIKIQLMLHENVRQTPVEICGPTENVVAQMSSESIAKQLTLLDHELLSKIHPVEFVYKNFSIAAGNAATKTTSNLDEFIARFDAESYWVAAEIQLPVRTKDQASLISKFIKAAAACQELGNFFSVFAIIGALGFPEVRRLKSAWERVPEKMKRKQQELEGLMNPSKNMKKYRDSLLSLDEKPVVPFLPIHLKDIVFAKEAGPSRLENGAINFRKLWLTARCVAPVASVLNYDQIEKDNALQTYLRASVVDTKVPFDRTNVGRRGSSMRLMKEAIKDSFLQARGQGGSTNTSTHKRHRLSFWKDRKKSISTSKISISEPKDVTATGYNPFMGAGSPTSMPGRSINNSQVTPRSSTELKQSHMQDSSNILSASLMNDSVMVELAGTPPPAHRRMPAQRTHTTTNSTRATPTSSASYGEFTTPGKAFIAIPPPPGGVNRPVPTAKVNNPSHTRVKEYQDVSWSPGPAHRSAAVKRFELGGGQSALDSSYVEIYDDAIEADA